LGTDYGRDSCVAKRLTVGRFNLTPHSGSMLKTQIIIKALFLAFLLSVGGSACSPSPDAIATAIAKTQAAQPTSTPSKTETPLPTATLTETSTPTPTSTQTPVPLFVESSSYYLPDKGDLPDGFELDLGNSGANSGGSGLWTATYLDMTTLRGVAFGSMVAPDILTAQVWYSSIVSQAKAEVSNTAEIRIAKNTVDEYIALKGPLGTGMIRGTSVAVVIRKLNFVGYVRIAGGGVGGVNSAEQDANYYISLLLKKLE
jgi:hypothetical protein